MPRVVGFDYLRSFALLLVLLQHQLSVFHKESLVSWNELDCGQLGVAIFLALSGILAQQTSRDPWGWFWTRLKRIYPTYWIVIGLSLILAAMFGHKSFDFHQAASQLAGTGFFTHRYQLINGATWFVSFLLACYAVVFLLMLSKRPVLLTVPLLILAAASLLLDYEPVLASHAMTFFLSYLLAAYSRPMNAYRNYLITGLLSLLASSINIYFGYTAMTLILVSGSFFLTKANKSVIFTSAISYEFYLLHVIFIAGARDFLGRWPTLSVLAGIGSATCAAFLLNRAITVGVGYFKRRPRK